MTKNKAIFLDRDGVINVDKGFVHKSEDIIFMDGLFNFCRAARAKGYLLIVVTNQSGIGRGLYSEDDFHALMRWMRARFEKEGCPLTAYYYCPHDPDADCDCRKPKPGMILRAVSEHNIDVAQSMMIGDREKDVEAGKAAGVKESMLYRGAFPPIA